MKTNIQKVKYNKDDLVAKWWTCDEICDECKVAIFEAGERITNKEPNMDRPDYCLNCLMAKLDEKENKGR